MKTFLERLEERRRIKAPHLFADALRTAEEVKPGGLGVLYDTSSLLHGDLAEWAERRRIEHYALAELADILSVFVKAAV